VEKSIVVSKIKILGIVGSPRKNSNTEVLVRKALEGAASTGEVETDIYLLAGKRINPCSSCYVCRRKRTRCIFMENDDMLPLWQKFQDADGIIVGSPVYVMSIPGQLKSAIDRISNSLCSVYLDNPNERPVKVGGAIVQGMNRYGGQEFALSAIINFYLAIGIIPVSGEVPLFYIGALGSTYGGAETGNIAR
jgi:multimeric flavodoxin WrbA